MQPEQALKAITPKATDFSQWYVDVVRKAELMDYAPVKGFMVIRPYGYRIWELIQAELDARFRASGHENAYFPLLIPQSLLEREAAHVQGFSPEVAWVTRGGSEELAEPLAVRPTSETIIGAMYARWVQSYRDLPLLINQWANVVRWEKATRPFLRTTEFLWQEGHTVHRTAEEAQAEARRMLDIYRETAESLLAVPVVAGVKSAGERFAGAVDTYTIEALMSDGRALQAGTSHFLGQNFSRAFDIRFLDEDGQEKFGWTTSWGTSTRLIGALIMVHGDDRGLRLPPRVAPVQVVVVPIAAGPRGPEVLEAARALTRELEAVARVRLDDRPEYTPGYKYNDWEMRGVPLRVEIGPRDVDAGTVVLARRDVGTKETVPRAGVREAVAARLEAVQQELLEQARRFRDSHTYPITREADMEAYGFRGFFAGDWCGEEACAQAVKERHGITIRCLPFGEEPQGSGCIVCGRPARARAWWARAY
ncbi:Proline--tRNA ligase [Candidatus Hydrogenisulfobacillus filiaventi]|uniref:Proline--tRNA ligase n=1 Tax=Candidatus Hydrogenisulfobacillus filiaventi TaxID=2707344 RepID=A0A6F8ZH36_9FIRM|nr:proline--tRNA ligase [Bacillota bacterium]CAB1128765.1 Proline--tRNA ligase [Candidatus Hydrogenisulfobacillus filiaventi]